MVNKRTMPTQKPQLFPRAERPSSIAELVERANLDEWIHAQASNLELTNSVKAVADLIDACSHLELEDLIEIYTGQVDERLLEEKFLQLIRVAGLLFDVFPAHSQYKAILETDEFETASLPFHAILSVLVNRNQT
ncbi:hypothetical protein JR316_0006677 [Psilocybe cubensis]|uniref:Uncharacterized protein n=2 Tax=Psilocybe cubensis TaxID=181762 RepID=A0ACB8GYM9_PSICU|nr:hypothetical protein JR316_0006677 [Psilocybe cubensis]KAH9480080.1 hypothetical protein JR316_0006677 [Psilocybe cubensis]